LRLSLLVNPESGSGEAAGVAERLRRLGAETTTIRLDEAGGLGDPATDRIVVAGGDGSLGVAAETAGRLGLPLAVIPAGTANDFARAMELPSELDAAERLAVEGRRTQRLDLGRIGSRPFVNVASLGLPPAAASRADEIKGLLGSGAYALGALRAGLTATPVECDVRCDGGAFQAGSLWQLTVACSGAFGGGAGVDADPADGRFDVVAIEAGSRLGLVFRAWGLRYGDIARQRGVRTARAREVRIDAAPGTRYNVDGEVIAGGAETLRVEPDAFELIIG
jgi:diacylglycerol kinase (ATP)